MKVLEFLKLLRPPTLDRLAAHSNNIFATTWRAIRSVVFLDLVVYWAIAFGLILPALFGSGFAFGGGVLAALATAAVFFVFTFLCSAAVTAPLRALGFMTQMSGREYKVQWCAFTAGTALFFFLATTIVPAVLSVSGVLAYVVGTAFIAAIGAWSYPPRKRTAGK